MTNEQIISGYSNSYDYTRDGFYNKYPKLIEKYKLYERNPKVWMMTNEEFISYMRGYECPICSSAKTIYTYVKNKKTDRFTPCSPICKEKRQKQINKISSKRMKTKNAVFVQDIIITLKK